MKAAAFIFLIFIISGIDNNARAQSLSASFERSNVEEAIKTPDNTMLEMSALAPDPVWGSRRHPRSTRLPIAYNHTFSFGGGGILVQHIVVPYLRLDFNKIITRDQLLSLNISISGAYRTDENTLLGACTCDEHKAVLLYASPGFRLNTAKGKPEMIDFSVGPSLLIGWASEKRPEGDSPYNQVPTTHNFPIYGLLWDADMHIHSRPNPHVLSSIHTAIGTAFNWQYSAPILLFQFGFDIGGGF